MGPGQLSEIFAPNGDVDAHIHRDQTEGVVIGVRPAIRSILVDRVILKIPRQVAIGRRIWEEIVLIKNTH